MASNFSMRSLGARRKVSLITYNTKDEVQAALIEMVVFAILLTVTTILAISCQDIYGYYSNESFKRLLNNDEGDNSKTWRLDSISNPENFWLYIEQHFIPKLESILSDRKKKNITFADPLGIHSKPVFWGVNVMLRPPILRQIRVKEQPCQNYKFLRERKRNCYGAYSSENQEYSPEFRGSRYESASGSDIRPIFGLYDYYYGGGYFEELSLEDSYTTTNSLQKRNWIDGGTRVVTLTLETYNFNSGTFQMVRLITEIAQSGSVVASFDVDSIPVESIWASENVKLMITTVIFYGITTCYTGIEVREMYKYGFSEYSKNIWNYLDWGVITTATLSLCISVAQPFNVQRYVKDIEKQNRLASMDTILFYDDIYIGAMAICTMQLWIRTFRFISFNQTMLHFNIALRRFMPDIFGFALILLIAFMTFALAGMLGFGSRHPDFADFIGSFFFMFRLMLHDFDYQDFDDVDGFWGPIYILTYIVVIVFILVNMFLAIISCIYGDVKSYHHENHSAFKQVLLQFWAGFKRFLNFIFGRMREKVRRRSTVRSISPSIARFAQDMHQIMGETPREIDEDEALREFYGFGPQPSSTSMSSYKSLAFNEDEVETEEKRQINRAADLTTLLRRRIDKLDLELIDVGMDMETLNSQLHEMEL